MTKISTQFLFRISFQQFVVATTGRRGSSIASQTKAITWNGNMKSKKHVQSRKELECKEFGMIQARQQKPKNYVVLKQQSAWRHSQIQKSGEKIMGRAGKSKKGQNIRWPDNTAQANVRDEKGNERNKRRCTQEWKILFVLHLLLILKPFMQGNRLKQKKITDRVGEQECLVTRWSDQTAQANVHEVEG